MRNLLSSAGYLCVLGSLLGVVSSAAAIEVSVAPVDCTPGCPVEHPLVSMVGDRCVIGDGVEGAAPVTMTESLTLCAGEYWLTDALLVGEDQGASAVLSLGAGATVRSDLGTFVSVQRGSKINAVGTASAPVVFTSSMPAGAQFAGDWGGLVLNGNATVNIAGGTGVGEAGTGNYGGSNDADSSGTLQYVRVEFGGDAVDEENELNGIAFQGVGSGTIVDHVTVLENGDDGVEFFGGTVNVSNLTVLGSRDDSIDWTFGWRGTIDTATVVQSAAGADRGIEADNSQAAPAALPVSSPTLKHLSLIGAGAQGPSGALLRRGTHVSIVDSVISNFPVCLVVDGADSTLAAQTGGISLQNVVLACPVAAAETDAGAQALLAQGGAVVAPLPVTP